MRAFWRTREEQAAKSGERDRGTRAAVTGGAQLDSLTTLILELLVESGVPEPTIFRKKAKELPGFYWPTKQWDLLVVAEGHLLACIECKSQVGSFGNNYNNRSEEAIGNAADFWIAYREGAFQASPRPWIGYFILLEETKGLTTPVRVDEPHFPVFPEFRGASYAKRYELLCLKLVRERLYDAACLILSDRAAKGGYREPASELSFGNFMASLTGMAATHSRFRKQR